MSHSPEIGPESPIASCLPLWSQAQTELQLKAATTPKKSRLKARRSGCQAQLSLVDVFVRETWIGGRALGEAAVLQHLGREAPGATQAGAGRAGPKAHGGSIKYLPGVSMTL